MVVLFNADAWGGDLATSEPFLKSEKKWELKQLCGSKETTVNFNVANVIIGVDMKFEKRVKLEM